MSEPEAASAVEALVRSYLDAAARLDHAALCSYCSDGARAILLVEAAEAGLKTDSCAAALAHIMPTFVSSEATALASDPNLDVLTVEEDRATVSVSSKTTPEESTVWTVVRERGIWKIGVSIGGPLEPPPKSRNRSEKSAWLARKNARRQP